MSLAQPGICQYCGCRESAPCWACRANADDPCWFDASYTVCRQPGCIRAEEAHRRALQAAARTKKPSRFAGWGYGAIVKELRKERGRKKRRVA